MALAYEDEARRRRALIGQMGAGEEYAPSMTPKPSMNTISPEPPPMGGGPSVPLPIPEPKPAVQPARPELPYQSNSIPGIREGEDDPNNPSNIPPIEGPPSGPIDDPTVTPPPSPETTPKPQDTTQWDTDGYGKPGYTATHYGSAPAGWDPTKWADPNHQSPKYVVGRILVEAGDLKDPAKRNAAIENIKKAYPGAQFNGKDKISIDGGKTWVDIFGGAGAGQFTPAWMPDEGGTGEATTQTTPSGTDYSQTSGLDASNYPPEMQAALNGGVVPTDNTYFMKLLETMKDRTGTPDRKALLTLMKQ